MDIKKILTAISDEECVVLYDPKVDGRCVMDNDDYVEEMDGEEYVMLQVGPEQRAPIPVSAFSELTIKSKSQFAFENMMELLSE